MGQVDRHERPELTVKLVRMDNDHLVSEYHRPSYGLQSCTSPRLLDSFGQNICYGNLRGIAAVNKLLDTGNQTELQQRLSGDSGFDIGQMLFELLFPEETIWRNVLQGVMGTDSPEVTSPTKNPVRLRIWIDDPTLVPLMSLPWRLTQRNRIWLLNSHWTFELVQEGKATGSLELSALCPVLAVIPSYPVGQDLSGELHRVEIEECLSKIKPGEARLGKESFFVVRTVAELADALVTFRPEILYYFGHGVLDSTVAYLDFGPRGGGRRSFADLKRMMAGRFPKIVFLNGCMTGASEHTAAGPQLLPQVPLVIASRTTAFTEHAKQTACRWFKRTLEGCDPVVAIHHLESGYSQRDFQWTTHVVHGAYRDFRVAAASPTVYPEQTAHRLDRQSPRALVVSHVTELKDHPSRRVEAIVAYGRVGNLVRAFCDQALDEIALKNVAEYQVVPLPLQRELTASMAVQGGNSQEQLTQVIHTLLGVDDRNSLTQVLRRWFGETPPNGLLWLNFGVLQQHKEMTLPIPIREWLTYCHDILGSLNLEFRMVSFLAVETETPKEFEAEVRKYRRKISADHFRCSLLDELVPVKEDELHDYLSDAKHCPTNLAAEATDQIFSITGGDYDETVKLIREGQKGWRTLLNRLSREKDKH